MDSNVKPSSHVAHSGDMCHQRDMDAAAAAALRLPVGETKSIAAPYNEKQAMAEVGDRPKNQVGA